MASKLKPVLKRRPTSYDVAARAGVSRSTVSLVLGKHPLARVSSETRERILAAAADLGYVADAKGRALATGRTGRIALVPINPRAMPSAYYGFIIRGAAAVATDLGSHILLFTADTESVQELVGELMGGMADGVILVGREPNDPAYSLLDAAGFPVVAASYQPAKPGAWFVDLDHHTAGVNMAAHLAGLGHRRIAYVGGGMDHPWVQAFGKGLAGGGRLAVQEIPLDGPNETVDPEEAFGLLRRSAGSATCWVTAADDLGASLARLCLVHGIRIPDDISIATRNRLVHADAVDPALTGIEEDNDRVGRLALSMCVDRIAGRAPRQVLLPCEVIIRGSTGPARRA